MTATIIDGKAVRRQTAREDRRRNRPPKSAHGLLPGLATVLVGNDPASEVYVRNKGKTAEALGFKSVHVALPADTTQDALLAKVRELSADKSVHGILVQLPLPKHLDEAAGAGRARSRQGCRCADAHQCRACCCRAGRIWCPAPRRA